MSTDTDIKTEKLLVDSLFSTSVRESKVEALHEANIVKLTGDASSRSYYRIFDNEQSYVACLDQSLTKLENLEEVDFFSAQALLANEGVSVPDIYHVQFNKGYVLQEDLGDLTFLKKISTLKTKDEEYDIYKAAIDELLKIHQIDRAKYKTSSFMNRAFDSEKLMFEVDFTIKHLVDGLFERELDKKRKESIRKYFEEIVTSLSQQDRVLTHRDFHSRNIMIKNEKIKLIDFQDMRMGIAQYDVVSLLEDCYYKLNDDVKERLKSYYWSEAKRLNILKEGSNFEWEDFLVNYNNMAIQRTFKALGSFAYIYRLREDIRYLKYIGHSFEQLKSYLFSNEKYSDLRILLSEVYYEY